MPLSGNDFVCHISLKEENDLLSNNYVLVTVRDAFTHALSPIMYSNKMGFLLI